MIDLSSRVNIPEIYGRASAYPAADAPKPGKSAQSKPLRINLRLQVWLEADIAGARKGDLHGRFHVHEPDL